MPLKSGAAERSRGVGRTVVFSSSDPFRLPIHQE